MNYKLCIHQNTNMNYRFKLIFFLIIFLIFIQLVLSGTYFVLLIIPFFCVCKSVDPVFSLVIIYLFGWLDIFLGEQLFLYYMYNYHNFHQVVIALPNPFVKIHITTLPYCARFCNISRFVCTRDVIIGASLQV